jgi:hypothetical protein
VVSKTVRVEEDPRITISDADRTARRQALMRLYEMDKAGIQALTTLSGLRTSLTGATESWKKPGGPPIPENIQKATEAFDKQVREVQARLGAARQRAGGLMSEIEGYTGAPTAQQMERLGIASKSLGEAMDRLKRLTGQDLVNLNRIMNEAGVPHVGR